MTTADDLLALVGSVIAQGQPANGTPGIGYGVIAGGEVRSSGFGVTALGDEGSPVTGRTQFRLCSITKPMTSTLALGLVEEGLLDLDEPVVRRIPELSLADAAARESVTLRHLLLHTSGLEGEWRGDLEGYGAGEDALAGLVADYGKLGQYAPVGRFWGYCNTGYWLAGRLIEVATGTSYEEALRQRVLAPLGMRDTVLSAAEATPGLLAQPHAVRQGEPVPIGSLAFPRCRVSSGGVISSVDDLLRFAAVHLGEPLPGTTAVLPDHRVAQLRDPVVDAGPGERQSLGWATVAGSDPLVVGHSGSYTGYATRLLLAPEAGIAVAVLTNGDPGGALAIAVRDAVRREVLGDTVAERENVEVTPADLERLTGDYVHPSVDRTQVRVEDGRLAIEMKGPKRDGVGWCRAWTPLEFTVTEGSFGGTEIQFLPGPDGSVDQMRIGQRLGRRLA